ncbi:unnamed protein product [Didymodactylos carnosus]|uniref:Retrotransposon gag domain-containing protein n=1 Tax=Didymodactylos carnosus TaxID=1234261 RepID=A0A815V4W4_9BILA|nr:unnamed protein product [Didymodactylos carnosus]CAF4386616.1 unnamed protein product [Didymodactylos carnosus]
MVLYAVLETTAIEDERGYIDKSTITLFRTTSILDEDKIRSDDKVTLTSILSKPHIPNVLERIQDFHGTKQEDVVAWIDQLEVALDLTDHAQGKWSKLAAWYLKGEALSWYIKNKNQVYDWDSFRQMTVEKYPTCINHRNDLIKLEQAIPSSTTILNTQSVSTIDLSNNLLKTLMEHKCVNIILQYGVPEQLLADCGSHFMANVFESIASRCGVTSNNTSKQSTTQMEPFKLMYGRDAILPFDTPSQITKLSLVDDYYSQLIKFLKEAKSTA